jgi:hypothetical protein
MLALTQASPVVVSPVHIWLLQIGNVVKVKLEGPLILKDLGTKSHKTLANLPHGTIPNET